MCSPASWAPNSTEVNRDDLQVSVVSMDTLNQIGGLNKTDLSHCTYIGGGYKQKTLVFFESLFNLQVNNIKRFNFQLLKLEQNIINDMSVIRHIMVMIK